MSPTDDFSKSQKDVEKEILAKLTELGQQRFTGESSIGYHDGTQLLLPTRPKKMEPAMGSKVLAAEARSLAEDQQTSFEYRYRPLDGAHAVLLTLQRNYGVSGRGMAQYSMFGSRPPTRVPVTVGIDPKGDPITVQVPWGVVQLPLFEGYMQTDTWHDDEYGELFRLVVQAPREKEQAVDGFFKQVQATLETDSIYKGKAFMGTENPKFVDLYKVDRNQIVYNQETYDLLYDLLWGQLELRDLLRQAGSDLNNKILLSAEYGAGKTVTGLVTGQYAVEHDWTFIQLSVDQLKKTSNDELQKTMRTAMIYQPSLVFIEDIDKALEDNSDDKRIMRMLELFDGLMSKGNEVMVLMTTNHLERLPAGMQRPGRVDAIVEIPRPDRHAVEQLIRTHNKPEQLDAEIDFDEIYDAVKQYSTAFITASFKSARDSAIIRARSLDYRLTTRDFIRGANSYRAQYEGHVGANHEFREESMVGVFRSLVRDSIREEIGSFRVDLDDAGQLVRAQG